MSNSRESAPRLRRYTVKYTLSNKKGIAKLLRDRHRIAERRFKGDTNASDILIDLHSAIESAALSERQAEAVAYYYGFDLTLETTAHAMSQNSSDAISKQAVKSFLDTACSKIAGVYRKWEVYSGEKVYETEITYEVREKGEEGP